VKLDAARLRRRRGMQRLLAALGGDEGLTRYVGGVVRDELLGLPVSDIDLATRLMPDDVVRRLETAGIKAIPTGIDHGTVTAVSDRQPVEITSLRRDVTTDGRRATIAYTDDWQEDAARRDFTINALMADPLSGEIHDYFGGIADLKQRRIRFIGEPLARIAEDHLRILRFFRFHARFGAGPPDSAALDACASRANDLMALSRERIADELIKLLSVEDPGETVEVMIGNAILRPVVPEIGGPGLDRLRALIVAEQQAGMAIDPLRRLSALLPADPAIAEKVASRLKLSNKAKKRLASAADPDLGPSPRALAYRLGVQGAVDRLLIAGRTSDAAAIADWQVPRLPIGGGALIERGLPQGPIVARTLRLLEDRWIAAGFPTGPDFERLLDEALEASR